VQQTVAACAQGDQIISTIFSSGCPGDQMMNLQEPSLSTPFHATTMTISRQNPTPRTGRDGGPVLTLLSFLTTLITLTILTLLSFLTTLTTLTTLTILINVITLNPGITGSGLQCRRTQLSCSMAGADHSLTASVTLVNDYLIRC
jgi:hypothetical protein